MAKQPLGYIDPETHEFIPMKKKKKVWPWILAAVFVIGVGWAAISDANDKKTAPAAETTAETEAELDAPETDAPEEEKTNGSILTALFGEKKEKEPEVIPERGTQEWRDWYIDEYKNEIVVCAKQTLDNYIANYDISLAPQKWNLGMVDDDDNVYAVTRVTWQDRVYSYVYIGQLQFDENGKCTGSSGHLLALNDEILYNDHYADEFLENLGRMAEDTP